MNKGKKQDERLPLQQREKLGGVTWARAMIHMAKKKYIGKTLLMVVLAEVSLNMAGLKLTSCSFF